MVTNRSTPRITQAEGLCHSFLAPFVLVLTALILIPPAVAQEKGEAPPQLENLADKAAQLRQLPFKEPLQFGKFQTAEELREFFGTEFDRGYPPETLDALNHAYRMMGLLKPGEEFRKSIMDMMLSQVAGLYDPRTRKMYVIWDLSPDLFTVQTIFIHEIVHALQDQHFDLLKLPIEELHRDDTQSAVMALVEGDATYAMMQFKPDNVNPMSVSAEMLLTMIFSSSEFEGGAPYILTKRTLFAYLVGMSFVQRLVEHGGYAAVDAAYADPPVSTEQILHPEKYIDLPRDLPQAVAIPDATAALGEGWRLAYHNELGELGVGALLEQELNIRVSKTASEGWDGDVYALFEKEGTDERLLLWESVWDSPKDAREFYSANVQFSSALSGEKITKVLPTEAWRQGQLNNRVRLHAVKGDRALMLDGTPEAVEKVKALVGERFFGATD